jgi:hypothetical protein
MRVKLPLIVLAAAVAVLGSPAGSGRGPARQRPDHFWAVRPCAGFYQALTKEVTIQAPCSNEASLVPAGSCGRDVDWRDR